MSNKQLIKELIIAQKYEQLVKMAKKNHNRTLKYIQMNLFADINEPLRWRALEAIGRLAGELAPQETEVYKNLIRRFLWAMNDESGNVPWSSPEGIGIIIANQPFLFKEYTPMLFTNAFENPMCHRGMLWSAGKIGRVKAEPVLPFINHVLQFLTNGSPDLAGYAAWAVGEMNYREALPQIKLLRDRKEKIIIYKEGNLIEQTVGLLAQEAAGKLELVS
ncbi:MAG: DVU0298 family protein [Peptococcaceae bacterium]